MEKLQSPGSSPAIKIVPVAQESALSGLVRRIELAIGRGAGGRIHKLRVEVARGKLVLRGFCSSFYAKQLAQHAAMPLCEGCELDNQIEVW